jgi:hypothetical protein
MHPDLFHLLKTLQIFDPSGQSIGRVGWLMAGGGALTAAALTGAKFVAKPTISATTGMAGTASAPTYATVENVTSVVLWVRRHKRLPRCDAQGEAHAIRQLLGHPDLPQLVGVISRAPYRPERGE